MNENEWNEIESFALYKLGMWFAKHNEGAREIKHMSWPLLLLPSLITYNFNCAPSVQNLYWRHSCWVNSILISQGMRQAGVNVFPAEDSPKYVSIQDKVSLLLHSKEEALTSFGDVLGNLLAVSCWIHLHEKLCWLFYKEIAHIQKIIVHIIEFENTVDNISIINQF